MPKPYPLVALFACGLLLLAGCKRSPSASVAATVNGHPITYADLDKQYYAAQLSQSGMNEADDQLSIQRLQVLRTLIDNELMLQRAEKLGLMAQEADVEAKFSELKSPYTQEEFQKQLDERKMTAEELKAQIRRDLSVQRLFNKEITSHISISDKDVADFYNNNKSSFNLAEPRVHIAQLLVTPHPDPNVRNLKSDKAQTEEQAKKKIEMLAALLRQGEDFGLLAQNYSEDPETSPNGGDLGFIPESALEKANVELRKLVMELQPGQISRIMHTEEGYRILKVISKEPAGQRELNDPRVQQVIRENLINGKDRLYKEVYYEQARNESKIVNYYASSILEKMQGSK
jgi:peptidyl-prolyl cis-trans isomerase SurA